ncbi:MAG TPA: helix-turn-helix transcriptional regulator [Gammaproteobacteria bacterium]|jgi:transcriptional regulator with XRE-family HTH domain|nr:helix-turn-helix transcriptional regulator [Gammaproteobacteria bacterium]
MKTAPRIPIPAARALRKTGEDINHARRRRRITIELMAERADVSRATISKIEKGDPSVSMGAYVSVLFVLGMIDRLSSLIDVAHDLIGLRLEDERLPQRIRTPRKKHRDYHES